MGWLLFESLLAFVVLALIVAWTMAPLRKRRRAEQQADERPDVTREDQ